MPNGSWIYAGPWGAAATQTLSLPGVELGSGALSTDGTTLYYTTGMSITQLHAADLQTTGTATLTFTPQAAAMGRDGYLYLVGPNHVSRVDVPAMAAEATKPSPVSTSIISRQAVVTLDGRYLLYSGEDTTNAPILNRVATSSLAPGPEPLTERTLWVDREHSDINVVVLSPDGKYAYLVRMDMIQKVDVETMQIVATFTGPTTGDPKVSAVISPDGSRLYAIQESTPGILTVLDTATMTALPAPALTESGAGTWLYLNPAGTSLLVGDENGPRETAAVATTTALNVSVVGAGTVTSSAGIDCGAVCTRSFLDYQSVTLTATEAKGSTFTGWSGACTGATATCTLTMSEARSVIATFARPSNAFTAKTPTVSATNSTIAIRSVLQLPGPGIAKLSITGVARKRATLCSTKTTAKRAGTYTLICLLGRRTRTALSRGALRLTVATTFAPTGGTAKTTTQSLVLPRTPLRGTAPAPPVAG